MIIIILKYIYVEVIKIWYKYSTIKKKKTRRVCELVTFLLQLKDLRVNQ